MWRLDRWILYDGTNLLSTNYPVITTYFMGDYFVDSGNGLYYLIISQDNHTVILNLYYKNKRKNSTQQHNFNYSFYVYIIKNKNNLIIYMEFKNIY